MARKRGDFNMTPSAPLILLLFCRLFSALGKNWWSIKLTTQSQQIQISTLNANTLLEVTKSKPMGNKISVPKRFRRGERKDPTKTPWHQERSKYRFSRSQRKYYRRIRWLQRWHIKERWNMLLALGDLIASSGMIKRLDYRGKYSRQVWINVCVKLLWSTFPSFGWMDYMYGTSLATAYWC